jgi:hypothetical protein
MGIWALCEPTDGHGDDSEAHLLREDHCSNGTSNTEREQSSGADAQALRSIAGRKPSCARSFTSERLSASRCFQRAHNTAASPTGALSTSEGT